MPGERAYQGMAITPDGNKIVCAGGMYDDYNTLKSVISFQWTPALQLYLWWSDPQLDADKGRVLSTSRQQMVWTVMHVALRLETTFTSPTLTDVLPSEMWMLIMTFVKYEQPPM